MTAQFLSVYDLPMFPLSSKIIPVFIGFSTLDEEIAKKIAQYSQFGAFGCRDLVTMEMMRQQGAVAYMSGCFSICIERRKETPINGKAYLYDPPEELLAHIPEELKIDSEEIPSPMRKMSTKGYSEENLKMGTQIAEEIKQKLKKEARLVITRRLHVALPCIAMGIPVICAHQCDNGAVEEGRFAGLDKIIKVYKPSEYQNIDWYPEVPDIEWLKEKTILFAVQRIKETVERWENICDLSEYYESTKQQIFYSGIKASYLSEKQKQQFLFNAWKLERTVFEYITKKKFETMYLVMYGAGDKGKWAVRRYWDYISRAKEFVIVDGDKNKQGKGIVDVMGKVLVISILLRIILLKAQIYYIP